MKPTTPAFAIRPVLPVLAVLLLTPACGRLGFGSGAAPDGGPAAGDAAIDASSGPVCGDNVVEPPEECDPVVFEPGLGCELNCLSSFSVTGAVDFLPSSPPDLDQGVFESDTINLIAERIDYTLPADLPIDAFTRGDIAMATDEGGVIRAGARVHIYLVHQDVLSSLVPIVGSVAFPYEILGLVVQMDSLQATDLPTVIYPSSAARTIEDAPDAVVLHERSIDLTLLNSSHPDHLRIVVATVAEHGIVVELP